MFESTSFGAGTGGFRGSPDEEDVDCEYIFYALLALGHLAS